ncbi:DUF998 domain-containing protein [Streptomyces sp. RKAG293]|uniref:DUF998 domain-containing protein n=1 Tax=Streptomyces sp. RKAG293 TaxID=2893403 RepID=UPI002034733C|nr:DUF998 domain-containing protein [Streptomyces sp. RKAG293]MCM2420595.1 DUF998 domain-containing protein [Streptomyces sp. RKAG293]
MTTATRTRAGAVAWIVGAAQFFLIHLIVQLSWKNPSYSWSRNNVSDLGNLRCGPWGDNKRYVCSPLHNLMNVGIALEGLLLLTGLIVIGSLWERRLAQGLLCVAAGAWIMVGFVPADSNENLHVLGALLVTVFGNLGLILHGWRHQRRPDRVLALCLGLAGLLATFLFFAQIYLGLGMGGMERFAVFGMQAWTFVTGCLLLRTGSRVQSRA